MYLCGAGRAQMQRRCEAARRQGQGQQGYDGSLKYIRKAVCGKLNICARCSNLVGAFVMLNEDDDPSLRIHQSCHEDIRGEVLQ